MRFPAARVVLIVVVGSGCAAVVPTETDIPVGGVREAVVRSDLAIARERMEGGVMEPGWLPDGFELVNVGVIESALRIQSVDLFYTDGANNVHIWQTLIPPADLGDKDPVKLGETEAIGGREWSVYRIPPAQAMGARIVEFSTRLSDDRTVSIDGDLDDDVMERILESLYLRGERIDVE